MSIKKAIIAIFLASFVGIMINPEMLAASNSVAVYNLNRDKIVKTVLPEPVVEFAKEQPVSVSSKTIISRQTTPVDYEEPTTQVVTAQPVVVYEEPEPVYVAPTNNIQIAGKTLEIVDVSTTTIDSGDHVNKYGSKFYWGHNSSEVFRGLYNLGEGSTFTMSYGGVTRNYRVNKKEIFEKNFETGTLQLNGKGSYMISLVNGRYEGKSYDVVLMTCYGKSVGATDATHRYVLFANAI